MLMGPEVLPPAYMEWRVLVSGITIQRHTTAFFGLILASACLGAPPAITLPGGRAITPQGDEFFTGPGPFGLALSPAGRFVVTADGGPNRYSLTVFDSRTSGTRRIETTRKKDPPVPEADDTEWHSVFMGLAFDGETTLYVSEGEPGRIRRINLETGASERWLSLNQAGYRDSYIGDLAFDSRRGLLFAVDQANFRLAIVDVRQRKILSSIRTGRLPFAVALSPDGQTAYVTNLGMFEYRAIPGADARHIKETGLPFPAFGFPSPEAVRGARRETEKGAVDVPGLGNPNAREANSLAVVDVSHPAAPRLIRQVPSGLPFGKGVLGGSSPSGVLATAAAVYVSNANQDSISTIDAHTLRRGPDIPLRIRGYESLRGVLPIGLALTSDGKWLLVAEAGINAIGVVDTAARRLIGHIPTAWFPTQVRVAGDTVFVASAKGHGTGPNDRHQRDLRRGTLARFRLPPQAELDKLTAQVTANNHFEPPAAPPPAPPIEHVVIIVKENRTYDEVFGDLPGRNGMPALARWGQQITPNHHAMAQTWSISDNFYADSEVSVDGHHWLVGSYPNAWTISSLDASYGGEKSFRFPTAAPGRLQFAGSDSSVHPEEQLEAGTLWHHLERHGVSFLNFGEGFELAGVDEHDGLEPTGARYLTNVPMPEPLYRNTSRRYPGFNMNIPDQYRASQFIAEIQTKTELPKLIFIHLPNDHTAKERPAAGYPAEASYVADNDLALGRILEFLSHSVWWPKMAVLITEDDAQSGVDHVDSHRTVLMAASPYARRGYTSHVNTSFPGLLKTAFWLLHLPPLNLYDAAARDLSDCFQATPDATPYTALPVDPALFDPAKVKIVKGEKPGPKMDDPAEIRRQRRTGGQ
jgi:DNA-binding beta-propeller fold protein YncE